MWRRGPAALLLGGSAVFRPRCRTSTPRFVAYTLRASSMSGCLRQISTACDDRDATSALRHPGRYASSARLTNSSEPSLTTWTRRRADRRARRYPDADLARLWLAKKRGSSSLVQEQDRLGIIGLIGRGPCSGPLIAVRLGQSVDELGEADSTRTPRIPDDHDVRRWTVRTRRSSPRASPRRGPRVPGCIGSCAASGRPRPRWRRPGASVLARPMASAATCTTSARPRRGEPTSTSMLRRLATTVLGNFATSTLGARR